MTEMTPLTLVRPPELEPAPPFNLQLAQRTLAGLFHCSSNLQTLTESILRRVSLTTSQSLSGKGPG
jgi:hypothetical protein